MKGMREKTRYIFPFLNVFCMTFTNHQLLKIKNNTFPKGTRTCHAQQWPTPPSEEVAMVHSGIRMEIKYIKTILGHPHPLKPIESHLKPFENGSAFIPFFYLLFILFYYFIYKSFGRLINKMNHPSLLQPFFLNPSWAGLSSFNILLNLNEVGKPVYLQKERVVFYIKNHKQK